MNFHVSPNFSGNHNYLTDEFYPGRQNRFRLNDTDQMIYSHGSTRMPHGGTCHSNTIPNSRNCEVFPSCDQYSNGAHGQRFHATHRQNLAEADPHNYTSNETYNDKSTAPVVQLSRRDVRNILRHLFDKALSHLYIFKYLLKFN